MRGMSVFTASAAVLVFSFLIGCGVDSGVRDGAAPGYTGGPVAGLPGGVTNPGSNLSDAGPAEQEVFSLVNEQRQSAGLNTLEWCDGLGELAGAHSNDMCDRGFFSHVNPEGEDPTDRARAGHAGSYTFTSIVPDPYSGIAENIATGFSTAQDVMDAWMDSPGHRANILNGNYTHIGVGLCSGCGTHWTQCFGIRH